MTALNDEPAIIGMANSLDLDVTKPADAIASYCHDRVRRFLRGVSRLANIDALLSIVCGKLNLTVHEIHVDNDIKRYAEKYMAADEIGVGGLVLSQMKPNTFGMLVNLEARDARGKLQFVAFIDCRGEKAARRVWTIWHEIAHCLTGKDQMALPLRRTTTIETIEKDPIERLTDAIAADFAFYEVLFKPILESEFRNAGRLSFSGVERIRSKFNPGASFDSTMRACVNKTPVPLLLLEAGLTYKKEEQRLIDAGDADPGDFVPSLRLLRSMANQPGRIHLPHVPKQWRVPQHSVIARVHAEDTSAILEGGIAEENMNLWATSSGNRLKDCPVRVEARKIGKRVVALVEVAT